MIAIQETLKQLRVDAGLSQVELGKAVGVSRDTIARVESGAQKVTIDFLYLVAEALGTAVTTILQLADERSKNPIHKPENHFEYLCRDHLGHNLTASIREKFESWYVNLEKERQAHPDIHLLDLPIDEYHNRYLQVAKKAAEVSGKKSGKPSDAKRIVGEEGRRVANELREHWNLGASPISDPVNLIRSLGLFITGMDLGSDGLLGLSGRHGQEGVFAILVNTNASFPTERQRFSIFHELAHIVAHDGEFQENPKHAGRGRGKDFLEIFADAFAGAIQVPQAELNRVLDILKRKQIKGEQLLYTLKRYFRVSYQTMLIRLKDIGYLNDKSFGPWYGRLHRQYENSEPEPLSEPLMFGVV